MDEYCRYAGSKVRGIEVDFIKSFDVHEFGKVEMGFVERR